MSTALQAALIFLGAVVRNLLTKIAQNLWESVWTEIAAAVAQAERQWREAGQGKVKRDWVVSEILTFVEREAKAKGVALNWFQRLVVRLFVGAVADALVQYINEAMGHDWVQRIDELEDELAGKLPFVEPVDLSGASEATG